MLSGAAHESVFNRELAEAVSYHQWAIGQAGVYGGKAKSKRCVFRCFLEVSTEMAERTDNGRLFQRDGAQE